VAQLAQRGAFGEAPGKADWRTLADRVLPADCTKTGKT
jgi:hypothetical protein